MEQRCRRRGNRRLTAAGERMPGKCTGTAADTLERNERRMFTNLIKSMGMRVIYPQNPGDKPAPDANAIYKTLMK